MRLGAFFQVFPGDNGSSDMDTFSQVGSLQDKLSVEQMKLIAEYIMTLE